MRSVRVYVYPDGGINRVHVLARVTAADVTRALALATTTVAAQ